MIGVFAYLTVKKTVPVSEDSRFTSINPPGMRVLRYLTQNKLRQCLRLKEMAAELESDSYAGGPVLLNE